MPPLINDINPGIALLATEYATVWCPRHLEPYRDQWPLGAPTATLRVLLAAYEMDKVLAEIGPDHEPPYVLNALVKFSPLCCFIASSELKMIYRDTVPV